MSTPSVFPLHFPCSDNYGWAECAPLARRLWLRLRTVLAPDLIWYGVAMKIRNEHQLTLYVYDMHDSFSGGIGEQIFKQDVARVMLEDDECAMLDALIVEAMQRYAERVYDVNALRQKEAAVTALRKELFGV